MINSQITSLIQNCRQSSILRANMITRSQVGTNRSQISSKWYSIIRSLDVTRSRRRRIIEERCQPSEKWSRIKSWIRIETPSKPSCPRIQICSRACKGLFSRMTTRMSSDRLCLSLGLAVNNLWSRMIIGLMFSIRSLRRRRASLIVDTRGLYPYSSHWLATRGQLFWSHNRQPDLRESSRILSRSIRRFLARIIGPISSRRMLRIESYKFSRSSCLSSRRDRRRTCWKTSRHLDPEWQTWRRSQTKRRLFRAFWKRQRALAMPYSWTFRKAMIRKGTKRRQNRL